MSNGSEQSPQRLSYSLLVRYGIGQTGAQVFRDTPAALLPLFMTTLLGVPAWMAGMAVILPKLWVIFWDPLAGALSDKFKRRIGRGPFLVVGALLANIGFVCLFSLTGFSSSFLAAATISLIFLLASTGFSAFSVPYLAIASELSGDPRERNRLIAARVLFAVAGVIAAVGLAQPAVAYFGGGPHGWRMMASILAAFCLCTMLVTAFGLPSARAAALPPTAHVGIFSQIGDALRHRDFRWLTFVYLLQCIGQACGYTVIGFVFLYNVGNVNLILPFVLVMSVASLASQPIWLAFARRYGNSAGLIASTIGWVVFTITAFTITPGHDVLTTVRGIGPVSTAQMIVLVRALPLAFFNCGFLLFILSLLTDTIDRTRRRSGGAVNEGVFSGIFSATEKLSFALAPLVGGFIMSATGFVSSTTGAVAQSASAMTGILLLYSLIPALFVGLSGLAFLGYTAAVRDERASFALADVRLSNY